MKSDPLRRRFIVVLVTVVAAMVTWQLGSARGRPSDFAQTWAAAGYLAKGMNPYAMIGPRAEFWWDFPFLYPLTAAISALPLAWLPLRLADAVMGGLSAGLLAWALTRENPRNPQLWVFASAAFVYTLFRVQMSPLLLASALMPTLGFLLISKPTIGAALFVAYPSRRAAIGCAAILIVSLLFWPWWVREWLTRLPAAQHIVAPITLPGGFLLVLAALKWRRPEARLLLALACAPHTVSIYETIPLFMVVTVWWEGALVSALTLAMLVVRYSGGTEIYNLDAALGLARMQLWIVYLPCLALVLRRPNVALADDALMTLMEWCKAKAWRRSLVTRQA